MINILPYEHKKMIDRLRIVRVVTVSLWAIILLVLVAMVLLIPLVVTINARFAIVGGQLQNLEKTGIVINAVDVAALETRAKVLSEKLATSLPPAPIDYLAIIRTTAPPGISLTGFSMETTDSNTLEVAGVTASRETLQRFLTALQAQDSIAMVDSPVSNYVKSANSSFLITVKFK